MKIKEKFLQLTGFTYPNGTEELLENQLPDGYKKDKHGNYYLVIGDNPTTMFTCHLDTACRERDKVIHRISGNIICTNGTTILGADDKAGMVVVLYMIEKQIPGLYYFFIGEEVGCIGSGALSRAYNEFEFKDSINKVVSFDRRKTDSIITHQWMGRCCSDNFAKELSNRLNSTSYGLTMRPDNTGILTDSAQFMDLVPECTNISVGYNNEHTKSEYQDIEFLERLCKAVVEIDWETLPIERDHNVRDYYDDYYYGYGIEYGSSSVEVEKEFDSGYFSYFNVDGVTKKMYVSKKVINNEFYYIEQFLNVTDCYGDVIDISWDGNDLYVSDEKGKYDFVGSRSDLAEFIPELKYISLSQLREKI